MALPELDITATINGRQVSRADVLAWEDKRIDAAAKKLGVPAPDPMPVSERREEWLQIKRALGDDEMLRRLERDARIADIVGRAQASLSRRRRICVTELHVPGGTAQEFADWFTEITFSSNQDAMERSCPDHFVLRMAGGRQQVLETNGAARSRLSSTSTTTTCPVWSRRSTRSSRCGSTASRSVQRAARSAASGTSSATPPTASTRDCWSSSRSRCCRP